MPISMGLECGGPLVGRHILEGGAEGFVLGVLPFEMGLAATVVPAAADFAALSVAMVGLLFFEDGCGIGFRRASG